MLHAFAAEVAQKLFDLAALVGALIDGNAYLAAWARHRAGMQTGIFARDVEIADLMEIEDPLIPTRDAVQMASIHIVGEVIDRRQAGARGMRVALPAPAEIHVPDRTLVAVAIDEIDQRAADAHNRRNLQLHRADARHAGFRPSLQRALIGDASVEHAETHGANRGAVGLGEVSRETIGLGVEHEVDVALPVERDVLGTVDADGDKAHQAEQLAELFGFRMRKLDELEAIGSKRIFLARDIGPRRKSDASHTLTLL